MGAPFSFALAYTGAPPANAAMAIETARSFVRAAERRGLLFRALRVIIRTEYRSSEDSTPQRRG